MARLLLLLVLHVFVNIAPTNGATYPDLERLHNNLTAKYNKLLRPTFDLSQPTVLNVSFRLFSVKELEAKTSKLVIAGLFTFVWNDFNLKWNPEEYGYIYTTHFPKDSVWTPEIALMNPHVTIGLFHNDRQLLRAVFDGTIYWAPGNVFESTCVLDITLYPFDEQTCHLIFTLLMYSPSEVFLQSTSDVFDLHWYYPNGLWELKQTGVKVVSSSKDHAPYLLLTLKLKRRPLFHVLNTLVPVTIMGVLNTLVFLLPAESGERVGFSVTVLLAMAVYMTMVTDNLPSTSEPAVSILCYTFLFDLCISTLVTVCTILGLRFHHKPKEQNVPRFLQSLVNRKCLCQRRKVNRTNAIQTSDTSSYGDADKSQKHLRNSYTNGIDIKNISKVTGQREKTELNIPQDHLVSKNNVDEQILTQFKDTPRSTTWKDVAVFFDYVFFIIFLLVFAAKIIVVVFSFR